MVEPELNIDTILLKEKANPELPRLDDDFYNKASKLIHELEDEKSKIDKESEKYVLIKDRLENVKAGLKSLLNIRIGKIISEASSQAAKKNKKKQEQGTMTQEEQTLHAALLDLLTAWRGERLEQLFSTKKTLPEPAKQQALKDLRKDYILVRLLRDIPTFVGADERNYTLAKEDVATVPAMNAQALITKKAAVAVVVGVPKPKG